MAAPDKPAPKPTVVELAAELDRLRQSVAYSDRAARERNEKAEAAERRLRTLEEYGSGVGADIVRMIQQAAAVNVASLLITSPTTSNDRFSGAEAPMSGWTVEVTFHEPVKLEPLVWSEATTDDGATS